MSAPDTNIERQKKRHRPPLMGFAVGGIVVVVLVIVFANYEVESDAALTEPSDASPSQTQQEN